MRESNFVKQNQEKWARFEKELSGKRKDPDQLRAQLIQTTDDLSYARTFYKNRSVRVYLNSLAQKIYINIYKNKRNFGKTIFQFFKEEVPSIAWQNRQTILISFILLLMSVIIGAFSSAKDEHFARAILSDGYVDKTLANIKSGDPFGIYKGSSALSMFVSIALNNLQVSLIVFLSGIFACYGSVIYMLRNGIMLGVFMYFFYSRGLAADFNYTVWLHGTIEILTLVIVTTAGMLLGRGLIFPGTLSRFKAFSMYGRKGALLFLSTIPFILFAAFIESFLTRYTELSNIIRGAIILFSLFIMVYYFVVYPYFKFRNLRISVEGLPDLKPDSLLEFQENTIYSNGQIFIKTIQFFSNNFSRILKNIMIICLLYFITLAVSSFESTINRFKLLEVDVSDFIWAMFGRNIPKFLALFKNVTLLFNEDHSLTMYLLSSIWMTTCCAAAILMCKRYFNAPAIALKQTILSSLIMTLALNVFLLMKNESGGLLFILFAPVFLSLLLKYNFRNLQPDQHNLIRHLYTGYTRMLGMLALLLLLSFFGFVFILSPISYLLIMLMEINITLSDEIYTKILQSLMLFAFMIVSTFSLIFYIVEMYFLTHVLKEISTAAGLKNGIEAIGKTNKAYGIEIE